ncbi:MAG TPA: HD domain-containing protein [Actinomycetota bacterium]|nr:HD domain-containing protein [Actinomycetota bacterium]
MTREEARALVRKYSEKDITYRHLVSVEGVMRGLARRFDEDEHRWGLAGIFHDLDQDITHTDVERHGHQSVEWLKAEGFDDEAVMNAVLAHAWEENQTDLMSKAIVHADGIAGLLVAVALVRPDKADGMKVSSVKKKLKQKAFAPGVERDKIEGVEDSIGVPLDEFIAISIGGLQEVAPEIGLTP